jgi:hypothetical protein
MAQFGFSQQGQQGAKGRRNYEIHQIFISNRDEAGAYF